MSLNNNTLKSHMVASALVVTGVILFFMYYELKDYLGIFRFLVIMIAPILLIEGMRLIGRQEYVKLSKRDLNE